MDRLEDKNTRYFIDLDLDTQTILSWDYGDKYKLAIQLRNPYHHRLFISKGQFNKLERKRLRVQGRTARNA